MRVALAYFQQAGLPFAWWVGLADQPAGISAGWRARRATGAGFARLGALWAQRSVAAGDDKGQIGLGRRRGQDQRRHGCGVAGRHRHRGWGGRDETGQGDGEGVGGGGHVVETVGACGIGLGGAQQGGGERSGLIGQRYLGMGHAGAVFVHNRAGDAAACDRGGRDRNGEGLGGGGAGRVDHAQQHRVCAHIGGGGCAGEGSGAVGGGGEGEGASRAGWER